MHEAAGCPDAAKRATRMMHRSVAHGCWNSASDWSAAAHRHHERGKVSNRAALPPPPNAFLIVRRFLQRRGVKTLGENPKVTNLG